jgi:Fe2+ or Zn2+ uptake regulation protein
MAHDELRESVRRVIKYNTGGPQADSAPEHVVVQNRAQEGVEPATVRDVLATLVDEGDLERLNADREPRYQLVDES